MAEVTETEEAKAAEGDTHAEVHANNTIKVTKEQISDESKQQLAKVSDNTFFYYAPKIYIKFVVDTSGWYTMLTRNT